MRRSSRKRQVSCMLREYTGVTSLNTAPPVNKDGIVDKQAKITKDGLHQQQQHTTHNSKENNFLDEEEELTEVDQCNGTDEGSRLTEDGGDDTSSSCLPHVSHVMKDDTWPLEHCTKTSCDSKPHVHCPLCPDARFMPSSMAVVRNHFQKTHVSHAIIIGDLQILPCYQTCHQMSPHFHCPVCGGVQSRRLYMVNHLSRCSGVRRNTVRKPPILVNRKAKNLWRSLRAHADNSLDDVRPPLHFGSYTHVSFVHELEDLAVTRCTTCCSKFHCVLCAPNVFRPAFPQKVKDHLHLSHWKHRLAYKGVYLLKCCLPCLSKEGHETDSHWHCPLCSLKCTSKARMRYHLQCHDQGTARQDDKHDSHWIDNTDHMDHIQDGADGQEKCSKVFDSMAAVLSDQFLDIIPGSLSVFLDTLQNNTGILCRTAADKCVVFADTWQRMKQVSSLLESIADTQPTSEIELQNMIVGEQFMDEHKVSDQVDFWRQILLQDDITVELTTKPNSEHTDEADDEDDDGSEGDEELAEGDEGDEEHDVYKGEDEEEKEEDAHILDNADGTDIHHSEETHCKSDIDDIASEDDDGTQQSTQYCKDTSGPDEEMREDKPVLSVQSVNMMTEYNEDNSSNGDQTTCEPDTVKEVNIAQPVKTDEETDKKIAIESENMKVAVSRDDVLIAGEENNTKEQCVNCNRTFKNRGYLLKHMTISQRCGKKVESYSLSPELRNQLSLMKEVNTTECPHCHKKFRHVINASTHYALRLCYKGLQQKQLYACLHCNSFTSSQPQRVLDHEARVHNARTHICMLCNRSYGSQRLLNEHTRWVHTNTVSVCHICGQQMRAKYLRRHLLVCHDTTNSEKSRPSKTTAPPPCDLCGFRTRSLRGLKRHYARKHGDRKFACTACDATFALATDLKQHIRNMHSMSNNDAQRIRVACDHCGKFMLKKNLDMHVRLVHNKIKEYSCSVCGRFFQTKYTLTCHMETHKSRADRTYRFLCSVCGAGFNNRTVHRDHVNMHTGERPYACGVCGKRFKQISTFSRHSALHRRGAVSKATSDHVSCFVCNLMFVNQRSLDAHFAQQHANAFSCLCGQESSSATDLQQHQAECVVFLSQILKQDPSVEPTTMTTPDGGTYVLFQSDEQKDSEDTILLLQQSTTTTEDTPPSSEPITLQTDKVKVEIGTEAGEDEQQSFLCGYCQTLFVGMETVQQHMLTAHLDELPQDPHDPLEDQCLDHLAEQPTLYLQGSTAQDTELTLLSDITGKLMASDENVINTPEITSQ